MSRSISALPRGTALSRFLMCLGAAKDPLHAIELSKQWPDTPEVAATLRMKVGVDPESINTPGTWGSELAAYGIGQEVIEALRPQTIIDRLSGVRRVPFMSKTAREIGVVPGTWVGENAPIAVSKAAFDLATMDQSKAGVLVVMSRDLIRFSDPSAEGDLRNQFVKSLAAFLDAQLLDHTVAPSDGVKPGSILYNATEIII